ncbi:MAG: hypothetical protein IJU98_01765 [Synergistaceae bacterium]|nr:hypothetical protein [Synergistaceae bacterium]
MRKTYANNKVKRYFADYAEMQRKLPFEWVRKIKKHIDYLMAAENFGIFLAVGLGHPEPLVGHNGERYSLRVSDNVRLIIRLNPGQGLVETCEEFEIEGVCDYHGGKENWYIP